MLQVIHCRTQAYQTTLPAQMKSDEVEKRSRHRDDDIPPELLKGTINPVSRDLYCLEVAKGASRVEERYCAVTT